MRQTYFLTLFIIVFSILATAGYSDTQPPEIQSVSLSHPVAAKGDSLKITVEATDNTGVVRVTADGNELVNTEGFTWEGDIPANPENGVHQVEVIAEDAAGNESTDSSASYQTRPRYGIRSSWALDHVVTNTTATQDNLYRVWGRATVLTPNSFSVNDGGPFPVRVIFNGHDVCTGDFVEAHGILDPAAVPVTISSSRYTILVPANRTPINFSDFTIGQNLQTSVTGSLPSAAPAGNLIVTLTSSDPSKVLLSTSQVAQGVAQITRKVNAGSTSIPAFYIQALDSSGTVDVLATAPGCLGKSIKVTLVPSGFAFVSASPLSTTTFSNPSSLSVRTFRLNPGNLSTVALQPLRGGLPVELPASNSDNQVGTISTDLITFTGGGPADGTPALQFVPANEGSTVVSIGTPEGFSTPSNGQSRTINVSAPLLTLGSVSVGDRLSVSSSVALSQTPPSPVNIVLTSQDPSKLLLSLSSDTPGSASITLTGVSNNSPRTYHLQGLEQGSVMVTAAASGFQTRQTTMTVAPSAFVIQSPSSITTTTFSANSILYIRPYALNANLAPLSAQRLRPGLTVAASLAFSNPEVGQLSPATLEFSNADTFKQAVFTPLSGGSGSITITRPDGFTTPTSMVQVPVTVNAPNTNSPANIGVGRHLQTTANISLQQAPPSPVTVTVSSNNPAIARLAASSSAAGAESISFTASSTSPTVIHVQGIEQGSTTLTVSAPGYNPSTSNVTVGPSGFVITSGTSIVTSYYSPNTTIDIRPALLSSTLSISAYQALRPGVTATVDLGLSGDPVGTLSATSVSFNPGETSKLVSFYPDAAGNATVTLVQPAGFSIPATNQVVNITVNAPGINLTDSITGKDLQDNKNITLTAAPPNPVTVTVTSSDPGTVLLSKSNVEVGTGSLQFDNVSGTNVGLIWLQGVSLGSANVTVSAPGYASRTATATVNPSGFVVLTSTINTTASSGPTNFNLFAVVLNPVTLNWTSNQRIRPGLAPVPLSFEVTNPGVGSITVDPVEWLGNQLIRGSGFQPLATGQTEINLIAPPGWSVPSNNQTINVTVNP